MTYINTFFYPEKIFFSNEIMYIILHNKKSILIYDLNNKIPFMSDDLIITNDNLITIDELRGIYLYNFDTKIKSIYESQENVIIEFEDGSYRINGTNNNHKIDNTNNLQYFIFKDYNPGDYEKIIKTYISKKYIIQLKENGKIYIHGDIDDCRFIYFIMADADSICRIFNLSGYCHSDIGKYRQLFFRAFVFKHCR